MRPPRSYTNRVFPSWPAEFDHGYSASGDGVKVSPELYWLQPQPADWRLRLKRLMAVVPDEAAWQEAVALSNFELDFTATNALDTVAQRLFAKSDRAFLQGKVERLAILSSAVTTHLHQGLRVAALRRGIWLETWENDYGIYRQTILDPSSALYAFSPTSVLFSLDAKHVTQGVGECRTKADRFQVRDQFLAMLTELWRTVSEHSGAQILQQTVMVRVPAVLGGNEHRHPASSAALITEINAGIRDRADDAHVDVVTLDARVSSDGLAAWHSAALWFKAKQEITLAAGPMFGDMVVRQIAARRGKVAKCCVLDLDNTLWGGVVGDHGVAGVVVGQGSAQGEAFTAIQDFAVDLRRRGILLAVCSKNDEAVAKAAFTDNPDMTLRMSDFACFIANWDDKATNLRRIAAELNIGLDSLVFVDDNPFERNLVRQELPMVLVPELPEEPELIPTTLADSGYFDGLSVTPEDFARAGMYAPERRMPDMFAPATDIAAYLAALEMKLIWGTVGETDLARVTQLINKTNQFNLTTQRYTESQVRSFSSEPDILCLQFRLLDRFGDNGLIAVVIAKKMADSTLEIDTWLMSCRVLSRHVEEAMLNVVVGIAKEWGVDSIKSAYLPSGRNGMVADLYEKLGFHVVSTDAESTRYTLDTAAFVPSTPPITAERTS